MIFVSLKVTLWQRKVDLEREMNDVLGLGVGRDVMGTIKKAALVLPVLCLVMSPIVS